jgi:hypothetical protein
MGPLRKSVSVRLEEGVHARLRRQSLRSGVPASALVRNGSDSRGSLEREKRFEAEAYKPSRNLTAVLAMRYMQTSATLGNY